MVSREDVVEGVKRILLEAETKLSEDVVEAIKRAYEEEEGYAKNILKAILDNIDFASRNRVPLCQDTGIPVFFVELGRELHLDFDLYEAIKEGVREATKEVPLRPNAVHPLTM